MKSIRSQTFLAAILLVVSAAVFQACKKTDHPVSNEEEISLAKVKAPEVDMALFSSGYVSPLGVVAFPDNTGRLAVIDQVGKVWITDASGNKMPVPFIDVTSKLVALSPGYDERGL